LNKSDLIKSVCEKTNLSKKESEKAIQAVLNSIAQSLAKGDKVQLVGFGTFETKVRAARKGRNPQTGAEIKIKAKKVPVFKAGKVLKSSVS
jgi:DNA-binding protein HU-beta